MISRLNGAQRIWLMFGVVFLASVFAVTAAAWPKRDPGVVADLGSPECRAWREMPLDALPAGRPAPSDACYSLRSFLLEQHVPLRSTDDYDSYRFQAGMKNALTFLGIWAVFMGGTYALGWSTARMIGKLTRRSAQPPR